MVVRDGRSNRSGLPSISVLIPTVAADAGGAGIGGGCAARPDPAYNPSRAPFTGPGGPLPGAPIPDEYLWLPQRSRDRDVIVCPLAFSTVSQCYSTGAKRNRQ